MEVIKISEMNILDEIHFKRVENLNISKEDLVLVRTQDIFPDEGIIKPKGDCLFFEDMSPGILPYSEAFGKFNISFKETKTPKFESARSTIHFCINGLVSNYSKGNFGERKYFLIEPLLDGLNDGNFLSLNPQDSYAKGELKLSSNAIICIRDDEFNKLSNEQIEELKNINKIYVYNKEVFNKLNINDDKDYNNTLIDNAIVSYILHSNGYPYMKIGKHGYLHYNGNLKIQVDNLINKLVKENNLNREKYFYSDVRAEDVEIESNRIYESKRDFLMILIDNLFIDEKRKLYLKDYLYNNPGSKNFNDELTEAVYELGLDKYNEIVDKYNEDLINKSTKHK